MALKLLTTNFLHFSQTDINIFPFLFVLTLKIQTSIENKVQCYRKGSKIEDLCRFGRFNLLSSKVRQDAVDEKKKSMQSCTKKCRKSEKQWKFREHCFGNNDLVVPEHFFMLL